MLTISCINMKGGCGKTSIIVNLGGVISDDKHSPLLIDLDKQGSATNWAHQGGKQFPFPVLQRKIVTKKEIEDLTKRHKSDAILIDTPPQLEDSALVSALISDIVLIPISPSPLDLWAAEQAISMVKEAREEREGSDLPKIILVPSRVVKRTTLAKDINLSLSSFGEIIAPPISQRIAIAEAGIAGAPIGHYAPNSLGHKDFINLWKFVNSEMRK